MNPKLKEKLLESLMAVLPITLIVLALSVALVPMDVGTARCCWCSAWGCFSSARKWR